MKILISADLRRVSEDLLKSDSNATPGLSDQQQRDLRNHGAKLLQDVKDNLSKKRFGFEGLSFEDKKTLLAYVIYHRQNTAIDTSSSENIKNDEDAAKIIYGDIYKSSQNELDKDLSKQLKKGLGVTVVLNKQKESPL